MNTTTTSSHSFQTLTPEEIFQELKSSQQGLSTTEALSRLELFGENSLSPNVGEGLLSLLWRQINNPLIWVLLASGGLAIVLGKLTDGAVVLSVVGINSIIGFIQEYKAGRAIEALSKMVPHSTQVVRDGRVQSIDARMLVPGDLVQLSSGNSVPADMRLVGVYNLLVDEAALTGESIPVEKAVDCVDGAAALGDRYCMVYSGTLVTAGTGTGVVVETAMKTEIGRISKLLDSTVDLETPLTRQLAQVSLWITGAIVVLAAVILAVGLQRSMAVGIELSDALKETLIFAIALAVGAIPEGLPAVVTIALAIGVQRMARRNAIIRHLPAVETLGATTVICSDKTGTLTCNQMTLTELVTVHHHCLLRGIGYVPEGEILVDGEPLDAVPAEIQHVLGLGVLCNDATLHTLDGEWQISGDPTEAALVVAAVKAGVKPEELQKERPRIDVIPFSSKAQAMLTLHGGAEPTAVLKGAPEVVLQRCIPAELADTTDKLNAQIREMGERGLRVLALAQQSWPPEQLLPDAIPASGFSFVGLFAMIDPPRDEAIAAIKACHQAGIQVKMITGDHRVTAAAIGKQLNLAQDEAVAGADLALLPPSALVDLARQHHIFARVAPEHKLRLVQALQREGAIVAMTGDGVNDAPALKQANIGVAMGITGTDVSKESADIVLADDNFASISAAVEEGRRVYDNLIKSLAFLLPTNLGLALILIYGVLFFPFDPQTKMLTLPMLPTQLLWINLVAAVALALPLAFEVKEPDIMERPPRDPKAPLFGPFILFRVLLVSVLMTAGTLGVFSWRSSDGASLAQAQSAAVSFVIFFQIFYMLHCRSLTQSIRTIGFFSNATVFPGVGLVLALQGLYLYLPLVQNIFHSTPLTLVELGGAILVAAAILPIIAVEKWIWTHLDRRRHIL